MSPCKQWQSHSVVPSSSREGVEFVIARMTFGRRMELMRRVRDLASRLEYFEAGQDAKNGMEASLLGAEIDRLYVLWGLEEIRGLEIDGEPATTERLIEAGPEELFAEALTAVRSECGLSENERKKLIVAFHFQFANRAGWDCDSCKRHGLAQSRRCGFLSAEQRGAARVVWGRKRAVAEECPKSMITGESLALVEEFFMRRRLRIPHSVEMPSRTVDAFLILQDEMEREERDAKTEY